MDQFLCWDCGSREPITEPEIIEHIKSYKLKTIAGEYLYVCSECGKDDEE